MHSEYSDQTPEFAALPPGRHLLAWMGPVRTVPERETPMVELQMLGLESGVTTRVLCAVTHWPVLRIGSIWENGRRVSKGLDRLEIATFDLEVGPWNHAIVKAYERYNTSYYIPPFVHMITRSFGDTRMVVFEATGQPRVDVDVIIPCTEIFAAYYGTSSRIVYNLLTGGFTYEGNNRIYDPSRSWLRERVAFVQLGTRMLNADAHQIARLAFDPVANGNAKAIVRDTIAASNGGEPYMLTAVPPFHGRTRLRVAGISIKALRTIDGVMQEWPRFVVFQRSSIVPGRFRSMKCSSNAITGALTARSAANRPRGFRRRRCESAARATTVPPRFTKTPIQRTKTPRSSSRSSTRRQSTIRFR